MVFPLGESKHRSRIWVNVLRGSVYSNPQVQSSLNVHQWVNGETKRAVSTPWSITQLWKGLKYWIMLHHGWAFITCCRVKEGRRRTPHAVGIHLYEVLPERQISKSATEISGYLGWGRQERLILNEHEGSNWDWNWFMVMALQLSKFARSHCPVRFKKVIFMV